MRTASRALCGVALASLLALPAAGQPPQATLPDTTPGRLMAEWLAMCGKPDLQQMTAWQQEHLREQWLKRPGANVLAEGNVSECRANGGFRVTEIIESTPQQLLVMAAGPALDTWYRMFIAVDEGGKAGPVQTSPAPPPEASLPKDLSDQAVAREVAATVDRLHAAGLFSGIAMIARGTQPFVTHAAGHADRTKKTPITPSTQFTIGSMGKMFTAAAIGQLVDQGKVSFDDTVGKFFPDFANETVRNKVTVAMLLTHTSGMGDFLGRRTPEMMQKGVARADEFVPLFEKDAPAFEPGARSSYSNAGLALLGAIVERASGEDYPAYIRKHVFEPAGMTNSDPNNRPGRGERMVTPYTRRRAAGQAAGWQEAQRDIGSPAGGAVSTAEDLLRFGEALRSGKLVSRATFEKMAYPHVKNPSGGYGYAMNVVDVYGRTVVGHGGGFPGVSTELYIVLDSPYVGVVLANQDPPAAEMVGEKARAMLAKMAGPPPAPDIAGAWEGEADVKAAAAAGSNVVALYAEFKRDGTKLSGTVGPSPSMQMPLTAVTLVGRTLTFTAATPLRTLSFQLTVVSPDRMEGTLTSEGEGAAGPVTFKRVGG